MASSARARTHPYKWIEEVGAQIVRVPEGRHYVFDVAERGRLIVPCYTAADRLPENFARCRVVGPKPKINLSLIRYQHVMSGAAERMWRLGQQMQEDLIPSPA